MPVPSPESSSIAEEGQTLAVAHRVLDHVIREAHVKGEENKSYHIFHFLEFWF